MKNKPGKLKLKPSARDKRRYFLVRSDKESLEKAVVNYIGVLGLAKSAFMVVGNSGFDKGNIVGSCLVSSLNDIRAGLALEGIEIEKVSGTLKGLK